MKRLVCICLLAAGLAAQASSDNYVLTSIQHAPGVESFSFTYRMVASLGGGVVPERAKSINYELVGGFCARLDVDPTGKPWLLGVLPRYVTPKSAAKLWLHGSSLKLGPTPTIKIGGLAANVDTRENHLITTKLPFNAGPISKPEPGWQPVTVSNTFGTTTLPEGIGILPMIYTEPAPAPNVKFDLVFKGTKGDQVIWVLAALPAPPVALGSLLYGLAVNPGTMVILPGFTIFSPSGELRFPVPATNYVGPFYVQALFVGQNSGYAPGSFSNVLVF